ncbi:MAG: sugar ABC transporter substrate-binding protein [Caldilineaceae bacterium]|nr:sugar ABC transporter substrate-binding protein [Caldilineaceae bacterium]
MDPSEFTSGMSRRTFLRLSAATTVMIGSSSLLAACAPGSGASSGASSAAPDKVTLRLVTNHGESDAPYFKAVVQKFMETHPDIAIDLLDIAGDEFYDTINAQGVAQQLPDVWYTRTFDIPVYASKGWTTNLQPLVDRDAEEVNVDDLWPAEVAQMRWQGDLYALPYDFSNVGIYYNKSMFDEAGIAYPPANWTWPELVEIALKFVQKDANGQFSRWGLQLYNWSWVFHGLIMGWGGKIFSDDFSECVIDSPASRECFDFFNAARKEGLYPEAGAAPAGVDPFASGLLPMSFQGSWATTYMRSTIGDKFDFDCTVLPLSPDGKSCVSAAGGAWGIAANTKNLEAAWTFLKFLSSTDSINTLISEPLRSIPGRQSSVPLWNEKAGESGLPPHNVKAFSAQMESANAAPYPPYWQDYNNAWNNMIAPMIDGVTADGPDVVLPAFQEEVNRLIALSKV